MILLSTLPRAEHRRGGREKARGHFEPAIRRASFHALRLPSVKTSNLQYPKNRFISTALIGMTARRS